MSTEVEETLKRIQSHRGVKGVLICNSEVKRCGQCPPQALLSCCCCLVGADCRRRCRRYQRPTPSATVQGVPIRSNLPAEDEQTYSALVSQLAMKGERGCPLSGLQLLATAATHLRHTHHHCRHHHISLRDAHRTAANNVVRNLDEADELTFLRIRCGPHRLTPCHLRDSRQNRPLSL